jgi:uncharacterized membrane protein
MKKNLRLNYVLPLTGLRFLIIVLLILGIVFRFINIDRKVYWHDEVYTSLRISGYTMAEVIQQVFNNREIGIEDLQKYQRLNPERGLIDTINSLAVEDPQHPPLYYVLLRFWVQWFGNSVAAIRSLTALISLLVFPCVYWLCQELFESSLVGWVAIALVAVSPIHVLFAQEAREYCLWTVTILLSSASLLQAMRLNTKFNWVIYAATIALGLYTFLLSGFVAIGHGIYVVTIEKFRLSKKVIFYLLASSTGLLIFAPWLFVIITNSYKFRSTTNWTSTHKPITYLIKRWLLNLSHIFIDIGYNPGGAFAYLILLILLGYSIYFLCRSTPRKVWLFILTLIGATAILLILPDIIKGGIRSSITRYLFPCYLGVQLAVAYLLATQIISASFARQKIMQLIMAVLLCGGVVSCVISSQAETWWNKDISYGNPQVAHIVNQAIHPLLISSDSDINPGNVISLGYLLEPKVRLLLVTLPNLPQIPTNFSDIFLFDTPSGKLLTKLEKENYKIKLVRNLIEPSFDKLWRIHAKTVAPKTYSNSN